ncbi:MAG: flagellar hook protein FlgE [Campylobacterales bacterium]|nr:flagellar hook protein FlgE [Campylobacterales bacterium]
MMRALWAGVTGLQAHQIAMDVESNNIANVNTKGYKYSRANFSNLLSQTVSIATAPQGNLGGQNSMQIGLGSTVNTVTKIFEQGSIETTDKDTDLAISGDGFFVVSPDQGVTYKYTRNGDFSFDANGNFVDSNGYIVQGWLRDETTGLIDNTSPITNILITPGLTTPAKATSLISIKANLDSGISVGTNKTAIYSLDSKSGWVDTNGDGIMTENEVHDEDDAADAVFNSDTKVHERGVDFGVLFDSDGEALSLRDGQGTWISYAEAKTERIEIEADASDVTTLTMTINGTTITTGTTGISTATYSTQAEKDYAVAKQLETLINAQSAVTGVEATVSGNNFIVLTNNNSTGTTAATKNIKIDVDETATNGTSFTDLNVITAYQYTYSSSPSNASHKYDDSDARTFNSTEDLREAMQKDARLWVDYTGDGTVDKNDGVTVTVNEAGQFVIANPTGDALNADDGDFVDSTLTSYTRTTTQLNTAFLEGGIAFPANTVFGASITLPATFAGSIITDNGTYTGGNTIPAGDILSTTSTLPQGSVVGTATATGAVALTTALSTADVAIVAGAVGTDIELPVTYTGTITTNNGTYTGGQTIPAIDILSTTTIIPQGSIATGAGTTNILTGADTSLIIGTNFVTEDDYPLYLTVTSLTSSNISANEDFTAIIGSINGTLSSGTATRSSQSLYMASLASTTEVYDSLGSKHTVRFQYTKTGFTETGGTEWSVTITVPEPGDINLGANPKNVVTGSIKFNSDGSLATYTPRNLTYTANNGSTANQIVQLNFGSVGQLDGITSFDKDSSTTNITQDGYTGGDLSDLKIDENGTIIGVFTNGRSFGLAQVAMSTFTNNGGLESDGGNCYIQSSNSGDPVFGQASTGGKGSIQASSLEMSNVDLSRSLTQLIVIQRGFQANSKTITTSDEMLNTLLQLK